MIREEPITLTASGLQFSGLAAGDPADHHVICIHGFPDSPATFRPLLRPLVQAGHRVVAPALRGYEPSSMPVDGDYSLITMADDVIGWLDDLELDRAHLVGHDWGAVITYVVAARYPDRVTTATTLAIPPVGRIPEAVRRVPRQLARSWYMTFFQLPWLAERSLRAGDWWLLRQLWRSWSPGHEMADADWEELRHRFEQAGVDSGTLGYYRQNATPPVLLGLRSTPAMSLTEIPVPTLIIHGTNDGCMDRRLFDNCVRSHDFPAGVRRLEVADAGHFVHLEKPDAVNRAILDHLSG